MLRLAYASFYKLVRRARTKTLALALAILHYKRMVIIYQQGVGVGGGVVPRLINYDRSLNEHLALSC